MMRLELHSYWRSGAAWRVRIALALKGCAYTTVSHDLRSGGQHDPAYTVLNPQGLVPALVVRADAGEGAGENAPLVLTQSLAIIAWLDEVFPSPPLLPATPAARAEARAMAQMIACEMHPLGNLRVLQALRRDLGADEPAINAWMGRWLLPGFAVLEAMIARHGRGFALGDAPGLVDCCLIPQLTTARRFDLALDGFPHLLGVEARCAAHPAFIAAHPDNQPGAS